MPLQEELINAGIKLSSTGYGSHKGLCPQCHSGRKNKADPSLYVTILNESGRDLALLKCYNCGYSDRLPKETIHKPLRATQRKEISKTYTKPEYSAPKGMAQEALDWFASRGITKEVLKAARVKYDVPPKGMVFEGNPEKVIQFPYFDEHSNPVNIKARPLGKKDFRMVKNAKLMLYGLELLNDDQTCCIVEGEIDLLSLRVCGIPNVLSVPNGAPATISEKSEDSGFEYLRNCEHILSRFKEIILCCDQDEAGRNLEYELSRRLGIGRCRRVELPLKDANEVLVRDGVDVLCGYIHDAQPYPLHGIFTVRDLENSCLDFFRNGSKPGRATGWPGLDELYSVRDGELTVITGVPSSGKSEWLDALMVNLSLSDGMKFAIFSPENVPHTEHISKLAAKYQKRSYLKNSWDRMTEEEYIQGLEKVHNHFFFIVAETETDKPTIDWILDKTKALVYRYGINALVIDPYNELEHLRKPMQNETDFISSMLAKVKRFARQTNTHIFFVAHPSKPQGGKVPKNFPTLYDISGGANWNNKADCGIVIRRNYAGNKREVTVDVQKIRFRQVGMKGETKLYYNPSIGVYNSPEDPVGVSSEVRDIFEDADHG